MSSFQNSVNQLIGSASYYSSINPSLREKQAERKATERAVTNVQKADKALSEIDSKQIHPIKEEHISKLPIKKEAVEENYNAEKAFLNIGADALKNREAALGQLFNQDPSKQTLDDYLGAQRARMEFEKSAGQTIQTRNEFMQFWNNLEEAMGPVRSNKAYEAFENSNKVGGKK